MSEKCESFVVYQDFNLWNSISTSPKQSRVQGCNMKRRLREVLDRHLIWITQSEASYETKTCQRVVVDSLYNALIEELETIR